MAWIDPVLRPLETPEPSVLMKTPIYLGDAKFHVLPKQWDFIYCRERFPCYTGGYGSGKTKAGIYRGAMLSMQPGNVGIVGRAAATDLVLTTQREMLQFFQEAGLLKSEPGKKHGAIVYCVDPKTNKPLGETSEIHFQHMEDPDHLHGYQVGWFWPDERSEIPYASWLKLVGRMRLAHIKYRSGFATGNPNGHDWGYDYWFNAAKVMKLPIEVRRERRGIHATSYENYYLDPQYIEDMRGAYPEEWLKRYLLGDMEVFEGQIFKEFSLETHVVDSSRCAGFVNGQPPESWPRYLGIDVGGVDPWAFEFAAVDPDGNVVFYNEIYKPGEYADEFGREAKELMGKHRFVTVIDWENKLAAAELRRMGINVNNARKRGKMDSITNLGGYLHPNKKVDFPSWHPYHGSGKGGSPSVFFTENVPNLIREVPQQRWKKLMGTDISLNQLDERIQNHAFDACIYVLRERPKPELLRKSAIQAIADSGLDKANQYYRLLQLKKQEFDQNRSEMDRIYPHLRQRPTWNTSLSLS